MTAHDSGWKWWLTFSFPPDFHRLHWHQLAWRTSSFVDVPAGQAVVYDTYAGFLRMRPARLQ